MFCLNKGNHSIENCRQATKEYLNCRMEKGLMVKEEWKKLGLKDEEPTKET
jgi:cytochrome c oxidase assembly protein subunit 19